MQTVHLKSLDARNHKIWRGQQNLQLSHTGLDQQKITNLQHDCFQISADRPPISPKRQHDTAKALPKTDRFQRLPDQSRTRG